MAIEELTEFAKTGQKDTDQLDLEVGFIVNRKPARQWFNWLFNSLTTKINELINLDPIARNEIVDNLTTDDAEKPLSAKQGKKLQDEKLDANKRGEASGVASLDENRLVPRSELPAAATDGAGIVQLVNSLLTGGADKAPTAEQIKILYSMFNGGDDSIVIPNKNGNPFIIQWFTASVGGFNVGSAQASSAVTLPRTMPNRVLLPIPFFAASSSVNTWNSGFNFWCNTWTKSTLNVTSTRNTNLDRSETISLKFIVIGE